MRIRLIFSSACDAEQNWDIFAQHVEPRFLLTASSAKIQKAWNEGAKAAAQAVPDQLLEALRPVGSLEKCTDWLKRQAEAGIDLHLVSVDAEAPKELGQVLEKLMGKQE